MASDASRLELEREAEVLAAHQLDLLAQIEAQLRSVHSLMRRIELLRARKPGQTTIPMSNGQRSTSMVGLSGELDAIEQQLGIQHDCCADMQATITRMQQRLPVMKTVAGGLDRPSPDE
jgi:hypothetical protein